MADITRRRTGELLRKLFEILMAAPSGMQAKDALASLASQVALTPYEAGEYTVGRRFEKIVRFATVDCVKAGWMVKHKGLWTVTDEGRKAHARLSDPEAFYREAVRLYREWKSARPDEGEEAGGVEIENPAPIRQATLTFEQAEGEAWDEVARYVGAMNPFELQELVAGLLKAMGYHVTWIAPPGKDGGVDIVAYGDPLGTRPPRIKVQVKRHQEAVRVDGVRAFLAILGEEDVGIFVNTGGFTKDAEHEARSQAIRRITLIDLDRLFELWVEHYAKLDDADRRRMPVRPIWFLAPEE